jgi:hypothetical protein
MLHNTLQNDQLQARQHASSVIDQSALDYLKFLMRHRFTAIVKKYVDSSADLVEQIGVGIERQDARLIGCCAETLRASSNAMGAKVVAGIAQRLIVLAEALPSARGDFEIFASLKKTLDAALAQTHVEMQQATDK